MKKTEKTKKLEFWKKLNSKNDNTKELTYNGKKIPMVKLLDLSVRMTTDLSIFKKCKLNRDAKIGNSNKLIKSIMSDGWIVPIIIVNKNMKVISGQHTLDTAWKINAPVYYLISEDQTPAQLMAKENGIIKWNDKAALKTYAITNKTAKKLNDFYYEVLLSLKKVSQDHKSITISQLLAIVYKNPTFFYGMKSNGGFKLLDTLPDCDLTNPDIMKTIKIFSFAQKNCMPFGIQRYVLLVGLLKFIINDKNPVDLDRLYKKLKFFKFIPDDTSENYYKQIELRYE